MKNNKPTTIIGLAHFASPIAAIFGVIFGVKTRIATQTLPISSVPRIGRYLDFVSGVAGLYTSNIAVSQSVLDGFIKYPNSYKSRLKLIYNGIKPRTCNMSKESSRISLGLPLGPRMLVTCGRLSRLKNHKFLLPILVELGDVHLAILGDGELRQEIETEAMRLGVADRLHLVGELPSSEVGRFLRAGDIFVFPSLIEAFGLALVEAMLAELPVVTSDYPALIEVVADPDVTIALEHNRWVELLKRLIEDHELRTNMGKKARMRAQIFTYDKMFQGYLAEIKKRRAKMSDNSLLKKLQRAPKTAFEQVISSFLQLHVSRLDLKYTASKNHNLPHRLVLSVTSYPPRFKYLYYTLICLLSQTVRPDEVVLWIAAKDYSELPLRILDLKRFGLRIEICEDLKSYKKIIPAIQMFADSFIMTVDDDAYYRPTLVEELLARYTGKNNIILCHRCHRVKLLADNLIAPYASWDHDIVETGPSWNVFPTGVGGVLYPLAPCQSKHLTAIHSPEICASSDDVWLYWMARLKGSYFEKVGPVNRIRTWPGSQRDGLHRVNTQGSNQNEKNIARMVEKYGIPCD